MKTKTKKIITRNTRIGNYHKFLALTSENTDVKDIRNIKMDIHFPFRLFKIINR